MPQLCYHVVPIAVAANTCVEGIAVLGAGSSNRTVIHQPVSGRDYTRGSSQNRAAGRAVRAAPVSRFGTGRCDFGRIHSSVPGRRKDGPLLQNLTAYGTSDIVRNTRLGTGRRFSRLNSREVSRCGRDDLPADQADLRFRAGRIRTEGVPRGRRDSGLCQDLPADRAGGVIYRRSHGHRIYESELYLRLRRAETRTPEE